MVKREYVLPGILIIFIVPLVFSVQSTSNSHSFALPSGQLTIVTGRISENTTWTLEGSPYIVVGNITHSPVVEPGAFLTIEPGVVVKFANMSCLYVDGGLIAQGNSTDRITFTSNATAPAPEDYAGVWVRESAEFASFDYCLFEYASVAVYLMLSESCTVSNSIILSCGRGILAFIPPPSQLSVDNCVISQSLYSGLDLTDTELVISNSKIYECDIGITSSGSIAAENCNISENRLFGIRGDTGYLRNSTILHNGVGVYGLSEVHYTLVASNFGTGIELCTKVSNCTVLQNGEYGVYRADSTVDSVVLNNTFGVKPNPSPALDTPTEIRRCIISSNLEAGVSASTTGSNLTIESCNITDNGWAPLNGGAGIRYEGTGPLTVHSCNIHGNLEYEFKNTDDYYHQVDAENNWWGTTNTTIIDEKIYDYYDNLNFGIVVYEPYLTQPIEIPAPVCPPIPPSLPPPPPPIPEFPSIIILPLFIITTLLAVIIYRRKYSKSVIS